MGFAVDPTVVKFIVGAVLVAAAYVVYLQTKRGKIQQTIPEFRGRPMVITQVGLRRMREKIPLSANKYQIIYEGEDAYKQTYTRTATFDELVPLYPDHMTSGGSPAVFIEYDHLLEIVDNYEHGPTRKILKRAIGEIVKKFDKRGISDAAATRALEELSTITRELMQQPRIATEMVNKLGKETDKRTKAESDLLAAKAGIDGIIERQSSRIERIASAKGRNNDKRDGGQN